MHFFYHFFKSFPLSVLLPLSVADELFSRDCELPLIFEVKTKNNVSTYCGVLEFTAPENNIIVPSWLFDSLQTSEGAKVDVRCVKLKQGSKVKIQPHSKEFYKIEDHKTVMENSLLNFATLTEGQSIPIFYKKEIHLVAILETKPERAVSVMTDHGFLELGVDFEPAVDLIDEEHLAAKQEAAVAKKQQELEAEKQEIIAKIQLKREEKRAKLKPEPELGPTVALVRFRFPNGKVLDRRFEKSDSVEEMYHVIETLANPSLWVPRADCEIELSTAYPRLIVPYSAEKTIDEMGLFPKGAIVLTERAIHKETM